MNQILILRIGPEGLKRPPVVSEREAEILKPLSSLEVVEKEEANFDTEISEEDVAGEWKLRGQVLMRSPVQFVKRGGLFLFAEEHLHGLGADFVPSIGSLFFRAAILKLKAGNVSCL